MPNSQIFIPHRIVIYAKDIIKITGRSERTARKMLQQIRESNGKRKGDLVSVEEFCRYSGLKEDTAYQFMKY